VKSDTTGTEPQVANGDRPVDVDTGFWLWVAALPLMVVGYTVDLLNSETRAWPVPILLLSGLFVLVVAAVVLTFQILMRHGYRWARTVLTGGGVATIIYVLSNLFSVERPAVPAVTYAVSAIVGSVLIAGGVYLLHRKDAHAFFTR
jgi:hypothetical protein